jgi:TubC N-terminal docking domain
MSQADGILSELQRRGVVVAMEGNILCLRPKRALDDTLLARIREAKPTILDALRANLAACGSPYCAGCYDVGNGKRIHPPKCGKDYLDWFKRWGEKGGRCSDTTRRISNPDAP